MIILNGVHFLIILKINNDVAKTIRDMRNNRNMSYGEIADIFDLSRATIINICKNRIYT